MGPASVRTANSRPRARLGMTCHDPHPASAKQGRAGKVRRSAALPAHRKRTIGRLGAWALRVGRGHLGPRRQLVAALVCPLVGFLVPVVIPIVPVTVVPVPVIPVTVVPVTVVPMPVVVVP